MPLRLRPLRVACFIGVATLVAGMTACAPARDRVSPVDPSPSRTAVGACLGEVRTPGVTAQPSTLHLPIDGVIDDYVQTELLIERGDGACASAPPTLGRLSDACAPATGDGPTVAATTLWSSTDDLMETMFSAGADRVLSETVVGYVEPQAHPFGVRLTAWRFPRGVPAAHPVLNLLYTCATAKTVDDVTRIAEGDETAYRYSVAGDVAYLTEAIHVTDSSGDVRGLAQTTSGLLPADALEAFAQWFEHVARGTLR